MTITTSAKYNFEKAENDIFSWDYWDGDTLTHKASGRSIYQMRWLNAEGKMAEPVEGETREQAIAFWRELRQLQDNPDSYTGAEVDKIAELTEREFEPEHGVNGYCRKCHSYCYSDCEAN